MVEHNEIEMVEHNEIIENKGIPMQILRNATNNFGSVYRCTLQDGRNIAVKKMNNPVFVCKGLNKFKSEVIVLTREMTGCWSISTCPKDLVQSSKHNEIEMAEHNEIEMAEHNEIKMVEHNEIIENKAIPMQILRDATNNF
ncbi:receptor-like kinase TMK2 [Raphanus sativus]|nr:receptor-like kinase TMK2 [Raphanus sativus]